MVKRKRKSITERLKSKPISSVKWKNWEIDFEKDGFGVGITSMFNNKLKLSVHAPPTIFKTKMAALKKAKQKIKDFLF